MQLSAQVCQHVPVAKVSTAGLRRGIGVQPLPLEEFVEGIGVHIRCPGILYHALLCEYVSEYVVEFLELDGSRGDAASSATYKHAAAIL